MSDLAVEIRKTLETLCEPGKAVELRIMSKKYGIGTMYYTDFDTLINAVLNFEQHHGDSKNYYITFNELDQRVMRRRDKIEWGRNAEPTTRGEDVVRRRWLPIDIDPDLPKGVSATDEEKEVAKAVAYAARDCLRGIGYPDPVMGDSGNGYWLFYRVDIPADPASRNTANKLINYVDAELAPHTGAKFDHVVDPNRICKLFGTIARKGVNTPETPHRQSRLIEGVA